MNARKLARPLDNRTTDLRIKKEKEKKKRESVSELQKRLSRNIPIDDAVQFVRKCAPKKAARFRDFRKREPTRRRVKALGVSITPNAGTRFLSSSSSWIN